MHGENCLTVLGCFDYEGVWTPKSVDVRVTEETHVGLFYKEIQKAFEFAEKNREIMQEAEREYVHSIYYNAINARPNTIIGFRPYRFCVAIITFMAAIIGASACLLTLTMIGTIDYLSEMNYFVIVLCGLAIIITACKAIHERDKVMFDGLQEITHIDNGEDNTRDDI